MSDRGVERCTGQAKRRLVRAIEVDSAPPGAFIGDAQRSMEDRVRSTVFGLPLHVEESISGIARLGGEADLDISLDTEISHHDEDRHRSNVATQICTKATGNVLKGTSNRGEIVQAAHTGSVHRRSEHLVNSGAEEVHEIRVTTRGPRRYGVPRDEAAEDFPPGRDSYAREPISAFRRRGSVSTATLLMKQDLPTVAAVRTVLVRGVAEGQKREGRFAFANCVSAMSKPCVLVTWVS